MSSSLGCLLESATGFAGSLTIIASSRGLDCASTSVSPASRVYCSNSLLNEAVFSSTTLAGCGGGHMTCLAAAHFAALLHVVDSIFRSSSGKWFNDLWDTLRGGASLFAEPVEDFYILVNPFIPFGTCSWGSQLHTAVIAVWYFILIVSQYVIHSRSTKCLPESDSEGMSHAFWCYLLVLPFGTTTRNLHLIDLKCCQALAWQLADILPHSLTRFASC